MREIPLADEIRRTLNIGEMVSTFGPLTVVWVPGGDSDA